MPRVAEPLAVTYGVGEARLVGADDGAAHVLIVHEEIGPEPVDRLFDGGASGEVFEQAVGALPGVQDVRAEVLKLALADRADRLVAGQRRGDDGPLLAEQFAQGEQRILDQRLGRRARAVVADRGNAGADQVVQELDVPRDQIDPALRIDLEIHGDAAQGRIDCLAIALQFGVQRAYFQ